MKRDGIVKILKELKKEVSQKYKAEIRGIFGSYVKGKAKKNSDIDILVDFDERADLLDLVRLSLYLEKRLKRKVDIVPEDALREEIKENILQEAVRI